MQKTILFSSDEYQLHGTLHLPAIKNPPVVIGSHGLLSTGDSPKQIALAETCVQHNMAYFRYDHRGCGKSDGEFTSATTFEGRCRDLISAVKTLRGLPETGDAIALFGSSFGGAISLAMAMALNIASIVTVAAPLCSELIKEPYVNDSANKPVMQMLDKDKLFFDIRDRISVISHLLIFHGDDDRIVPFENALELNQKAKKPKMLICQKTGDHPMSNEIHQEEFIDQAVAWFKKYFRTTS
ncbi:MAG: alpha/beta hydrolase [Desulfobacteraceae bacterium]|nr:alpha/beta fold hydrolase [Desulfobacteraceae bacterium]MBC2756369.1 alpha/beta hydrolase [Desulfobacteraceae bacterium]